MKYYIADMNSFTEEKKADFLSFLDKEKKEQYLSAKNHNRKNEILLSQGFAKETISKEFGTDKKDLIFSVTEKGKPFCKSHPEIHFSLSHCENFIVLAISHNEIGIDIEKLKTPSDKLVNRVCCENEISLINSTENKNIIFTEIWTRKEAYLKAIGTGIDRNLSEIDTTANSLNFITEKYEDYIISVFSL